MEDGEGQRGWKEGDMLNNILFIVTKKSVILGRTLTPCNFKGKGQWLSYSVATIKQ